MLRWWRRAGVWLADLAIRRNDGRMLWHRAVPIESLPLPWARSENARGSEVYIRPARGRSWPIVFLDDVAVRLATRIASKYDALLVQTSTPGGCHVWLSCDRFLDEAERHLAQRWLQARVGSDPASTSGEHLGRLAGFKSWKRGGTWVNVRAESCTGRRWEPRLEAAEVSSLGTNRNIAEHRSKAPDGAGIDSSQSGVEWGWVCGLLEAGVAPGTAYQRLLSRARPRRGKDAERYARRTIDRAALWVRRTRPAPSGAT
jgi:hypothetical protein